MRLFHYKRIRDIFLRIAEGNVTQASLAREMEVSTRTIRSDLKEISELLSASGNRLIHDRKKGVQIQVDNAPGLAHLLDVARQPWKEIRTAAARRHALLTALLAHTQGVSLAVLEAEWYISIYSLRNDIALLKRHFSLYDIAIIADGGDSFRLQGSEIALRRCLYEHLLSVRETEDEFQILFHPLLCVQEMKHAVSQYLTRHGFAFSDVNLRFFTLVCAIACERIRHGHWLFDFEFTLAEPVWRSTASELISHLMPEIQTASVSGEVDYLAMHLAAFCPVLPPGIQEAGLYDTEMAVMNHFLSYVSTAWYCEVSYDAVTRKNLLDHIKAMRIRINNGIRIINPLIGQIKRHYPLMYEMTLAAFSEMEHLFTSSVNDDEIGYLVMHIGAILDAPDSGAANHMTALIVSDQGLAATRVVCQKIIKVYPDLLISQCLSVEQYNAMAEINENIVISMASIAEKNRRVISLTPLPQRWELEKIKYYLITDNTSPATMLNYFSQEHFFILPGTENTKESVINLLALHLRIKGRVDENYLQSVLERESYASTLLDDKLAIPHPLGLLALSTMVTVAIFPEGIEWDPGKTVKLVFMLAISEDAFIDSMHIYDYLTNILDNDVIDTLSKSQSYAEFMAISKKYFL
ncbi:PRD domain-containing protein [Superficieibacter sp.]|uniref:BglG family transcription antiterminator n=1 Tax=Superficieibacter sp. TaxID=2303322 RepID=UPI0028AA86A3|nr:PRD domain-containing protein [Superficieibacter sp.]